MLVLDNKYKKVPGIYKISNIKNGKIYIGSTYDLVKRTKDHQRWLIKGEHRNIHLQRSWVKHGEESFTIEVLTTCLREQLIELEQHFIDTLKPEFNIAKIAGSTVGIVRRKETIEKLRVAKLGKKQSKEHIESRIAWRRGVAQSKETIEKRRESLYKPVYEFDVNGTLVKTWPSLKAVGGRHMWKYVAKEIFYHKTRRFSYNETLSK